MTDLATAWRPFEPSAETIKAAADYLEFQMLPDALMRAARAILLPMTLDEVREQLEGKDGR
jgi:hypothetical protein